MSNENPSPPDNRVSQTWAKPVDQLHVGDMPSAALNLNVEGRQTISPIRGFGQLWQKIYQVRLEGVSVTPAEVVRVWKEHFPEFQPNAYRFYPSAAGFKPGEVLLINASTLGGPISTGMLVMYSDDESFSLLSPQGHPELAWITFSAFESDGCTIAQVQSLARANDPVYEIAFRLIFTSVQEGIWRHVLTALAAHFGVTATVELNKTCVDPRIQWSQAGNLRYNAAMLTILYTISTPVRRIFRRKAK